MDTIDVGVIGTGWCGRIRAAAAAASPLVGNVHVAEIRRDRLAELTAEVNAARTTVDYAELVADDSIDALIISATPETTHYPMAKEALAAGKHVLLEKPIALTLAAAERLTAAIDESGTVSQLVLTNRYRPSMRAFLRDAEGFAATAGRATFLGDGATPGSVFGTPWRLEQGGLLDLGPHVLDALDAALGPIVAIDAVGDPLGVAALTCEHAGGAISQATISATTPNPAGGLVLELIGPQGVRVLDTGRGDAADGLADIRAAMVTLVDEFATAVRAGRSSDLDVHRGLHLQRLLDDAGRQLRRAT